MSEPARVVVTGCAGFVGSHLTDRLLADGWRVTGIDAFTDYYDADVKRRNLEGAGIDPRFELIEADLVDLPLEALLAERPLIIHLAAQPGVRGSFGSGFARYVHDNVLATQRLLEAARTQGCRRFVFASSSSVYGQAPAFPCVESRTPRCAVSPYGVTKATCEDLARVYRREGLETVGLRYFTVYGPRQRPDMAMHRLCSAALGGPPFVLMGDGGQSRDFTFVDDAVEATALALVTGGLPPELNVGGSQEATLASVIETLAALTGASLPVETAPAPPGDVRRTGADTTLARALLGWAPRTTLAAGLAAQLDWTRQQAWAGAAGRT